MVREPAEPVPLVLTRRARRAFRSLLVAATILVVATGLLSPAPAAAQVTVDQADPPLEGTVVSSPDLISLWFDQPLATGADAVRIEVINDRGERQEIGPAAVYPVDPRHVNASVRASLAPGYYSVLWTVRLAGENGSRAGAYGFRIGDNAIPGAATEGDAFPAFWAVLTRFLTLFGLALALGGYALPRAGLTAASADPDRARRSLIVIGAALALLATVAEPVLEALLTVPAPSLPSLLSNYQSAWWLRAGALAGLLLVSVIGLLGTGLAGLLQSAGLLRIAGVVLGATALMTVSVANVTAARGPSLLAAETLMIVLQVALVLLTGIAVHLALVPTVAEPAGHPERAATVSTPLRSLASTRWLMALLAAAGLIAIVVLSATLLTSLADLIGRAFGWLLLALGLLLLAILAIGVAVRRGPPPAHWSAAVLATIALLAAAMVAMMVPPAKAAGTASLAAVNLVAPVAVDGAPGLVHLLYQPAATGNNAFTVWLTDAGGTLPATDTPQYSVELRSLSTESAPVTFDPVSREESPFAIATADLAGTGWWQATVTVTPPAGEPATSAFLLLTPDPNVHGYGPEPESSPAARAVFDQGLAAMTNLHQVQFTTRIGGGAGTFALSAIALNDGSDGSPRSYHEQSAAYETIIIGDQQWLRQQGGAWSERPAGNIFTPSAWGATYQHATGFALGPVVDLGGEPVQVVTFWLPRQEHPRQEPAWFAWWVGTETGQVHREAMISTRHYMVYNFSEFNEPVEITPPVEG